VARTYHAIKPYTMLRPLISQKIRFNYSRGTQTISGFLNRSMN